MARQHEQDQQRDQCRVKTRTVGSQVLSQREIITAPVQPDTACVIKSHVDVKFHYPMWRKNTPGTEAATLP